MKDENKELIQHDLLVKKARDSYLKKEEFIEMLNNLNFTEIKTIRIELITGYNVKINDKGKPYVDTLGYEIEIT